MKFRIAAYNVMNLFSRAKPLAVADWADGKQVLEGHGSSRSCFLDMEEVDELKRALDYMLEVEEGWKGTRRDYTEVVYATKGNLQW